MLNGKLLLVLSVAVLCLTATPARADMSLRFYIDKTNFSYTASSQTGTFTLMSNASMAASLLDGSTEKDNTGIQNGVPSTPDFAASMTLQFAKVGADWTATSTAPLTISDVSGDRIQADFVSSSIALTPITVPVPPFGPISVGGVLIIAGGLHSFGSNEAILVGAAPGGPWTYQGETQTGGNGSDGAANQITVQPWEPSDTGVLVTLNMNGLAGIPDLDTLFGQNRTLNNGGMDITIGVVPVPGAVLLGFLGLGAAGVKLRKFV